jgi:hypothetical protein
MPLLVAPYMTRALAERCRELHLPFLDTARNACLEAPGLVVYIAGEPRPTDDRGGAQSEAANAGPYHREICSRISLSLVFHRRPM